MLFDRRSRLGSSRISRRIKATASVSNNRCCLRNEKTEEIVLSRSWSYFVVSATLIVIFLGK